MDVFTLSSKDNTLFLIPTWGNSLSKNANK